MRGRSSRWRSSHINARLIVWPVRRANRSTYSASVAWRSSSTSARMTSWPSRQTDLRNAGANWVDEEVVVDGNLTTSRNPDDLDAFCSKANEEIAEGVHQEQKVSA